MSMRILKEFVSSVVEELSSKDGLAHVEIYIVGDHTRSDQPMFAERDFVAEFDFDQEQGMFYEDFALHDIQIPDEGWKQVSDREWHLYVGRRLRYVAEISNGS